MRARVFRFSLCLGVLSILTGTLLFEHVAALDTPTRPADIPIVDQTNTLDETQKATLADQIAQERAKSGNQIAILIIPSLQNEAIENYSLQVARQWGVGTGENNNGVLLLVVKDDRRLRIEVGTGLEGALTDVQAGRIIRTEISPSFQQGQYNEGITRGVTSIIQAINGEYTASTTVSAPASFPWEFALMFGAFALSWLGSILGRTKSWWAGGVVGGVVGGVAGLVTSSLAIGLIGIGALVAAGLLFDKAVSANYRSHLRSGDKPSWWAGGGFLGGGGSGRGPGGFGGFGGGGFGGGGSSGSW